MVAYRGVFSPKQSGIAASVLLLAGVAFPLRAAEHITLRNGFDLICDHREAAGDHVRLYMTATGPNFMEVSNADIASSEFVALPAPKDPSPATVNATPAPPPTPAEIHEIAAKAGAAHDLDVELLASVIRAESNGNVHAVSRTGARGLMQLMPGTASKLGVADSFRADQNINGGTEYLNSLLERYHDNLALGARSLQRRSCGGGQVPRRPAISRDAPLRGAHHPRLQSPQAGGRSHHDPGGFCRTVLCRQLTIATARVPAQLTPLERPRMNTKKLLLTIAAALIFVALLVYWKLSNAFPMGHPGPANALRALVEYSLRRAPDLRGFFGACCSVDRLSAAHQASPTALSAGYAGHRVYRRRAARTCGRPDAPISCRAAH